MKRRINSRQKGARGERAAAAYLTSLGFPCKRAARIGVKGGEDIVFEPALPLVIEVKRDASVKLGTKALENAVVQACERAEKMGYAAACLWRHNRSPWALSFIARSGAIVTVAGDMDIQLQLAETLRRL